MSEHGSPEPEDLRRVPNGEDDDVAYKKCETGEFKRVDLRTRDRVARIQGKWESSLKQMWLAIIGLYVFAAIACFFLWQANEHNKATNRAIQASRRQATFETCQESNDRHDRTVIAFGREFDGALKRASTPGEKKRLKQSKAANIRLINVFIPVHKDSAGRSTCREFARGKVNVDGG